MKYCKLISYLFYFYASSLVAEQVSFLKTENDDSYQFFYQWLDHKKQQQAIEFSLTKKTLFSKFRQFKSYRASTAEQYVNKMIRREIQQNPIAGVQIIFDQQAGNISLKGHDNDKLQQAMIEIKSLEQKFAQQYLTKNFYHRFTTHRQIDAIKPDHIRFAEQSVEDFKPLKTIILEHFELQNIRDVSNYMLSFVQSIPYSKLISRVSSTGAGFNPPTKLLWENQGDCDSKVTLLASLLRVLMPRINIVLVFIDNHALIGIDAAEIVVSGEESTLTVDGVRYLLAEPTGPAMLPLGTIDPSSEQAVLQGQYTVEKLN